MTLAGSATVARIEVRKALAQVPLRVLLVAVILGPLGFAGLLSRQSGAPADALLGAWAHTSGFSLPLVILSFAGNWATPILAGVVAGDLFSAEDRHRTWKTILPLGRSRAELVAGKLLAAAGMTLVLQIMLAVGALLGGLIFVGTQPMVDLSGRLTGAGHLLFVEILAWLLTLIPALAFTAVAALVSAVTRNGLLGALAPVLVGLLDQLLGLTGNGAWFHLLLISSAFTAWPGLLVARTFLGPLLMSTLAALVWWLALSGATWAALRQREFVAAVSADPRRDRVLAPLRAVAVAVVVIAVAELLTGVGPAGVTANRVANTLAATFRNLTLLQQRELGHPIPAGSRYTIIPLCNKRGARPVGPGDWDCTMEVYVLLPGGSQPLTDTPVDYDVSVATNGCFKADAPAYVVGGQTIRVARHRRGLNPLVVVYGCFDVL